MNIAVGNSSIIYNLLSYKSQEQFISLCDIDTAETKVCHVQLSPWITSAEKRLALCAIDYASEIFDAVLFHPAADVDSVTNLNYLKRNIQMLHSSFAYLPDANTTVTSFDSTRSLVMDLCPIPEMKWLHVFALSCDREKNGLFSDSPSQIIQEEISAHWQKYHNQPKPLLFSWSWRLYVHSQTFRSDALKMFRFLQTLSPNALLDSVVQLRSKKSVLHRSANMDTCNLLVHQTPLNSCWIEQLRECLRLDALQRLLGTYAQVKWHADGDENDIWRERYERILARLGHYGQQSI